MTNHRAWSPIRRGRLIRYVGVYFYLLPMGSRAGHSRAGGPDDPDEAKKAIKGKGIRILLVDDHLRFSKAAAGWLESEYGVKVEEAESGFEAVEKIKRGNSYDFIFLDLNMPGMTGTQTYLELKKLKPECVVVAMSADVDGDEWRRAEELGLNPIPKPLADDDVTEILSSFKGKEE